MLVRLDKITFYSTFVEICLVQNTEIQLTQQLSHTGIQHSNTIKIEQHNCAMIRKQQQQVEIYKKTHLKM